MPERRRPVPAGQARQDHRQGGATEWIHWQSGTAQLLPRLIARRTRGPLFLTDRQAPAGTPTLDVCPETGRARLSYRRAEEIFEENTRLLANPLASPEDIEDLDGWTLHRLRHSALTHDAEGGTSTPMLLAAPGTPPSGPWSGTPAPASTRSPGTSRSATQPHVVGRDAPRLRLVTAFLPAPLRGASYEGLRMRRPAHGGRGPVRGGPYAAARTRRPVRGGPYAAARTRRPVRGGPYA
ncbi:hypothetical protein ACFW9V_39040, partial [Streptomyces hygroscopicus]